MKAFLAEPFTIQDLVDFSVDLYDDKFFACAYALMGVKERWYACADQLPRLFVEFMNAEIPDHKLYKLTSLMWQWASRLEAGCPKARQSARAQLMENLDFLDQDRLRRMVNGRLGKNQDGVLFWRHPWGECWPTEVAGQSGAWRG
jgi:hypothetical protein